MRFEFTETLYLNKEEYEAFSKAKRYAEAIASGANNPETTKLADKISWAIIDLFNDEWVEVEKETSAPKAFEEVNDDDDDSAARYADDEGWLFDGTI